MTADDESERTWNAVEVAYLKILMYHLSGRAKENSGENQAGSGSGLS
jgi:hypothetical protein